MTKVELRSVPTGREEDEEHDRLRLTTQEWRCQRLRVNRQSDPCGGAPQTDETQLVMAVRDNDGDDQRWSGGDVTRRSASAATIGYLSQDWPDVKIRDDADKRRERAD